MSKTKATVRVAGASAKKAVKTNQASTLKAGPPPNPEGRPSLFKPMYAEQAYKLTLLGATDVKLAEFFNVAPSTLALWKLAHPEFSESITKGKDLADAEIAESLYSRAKGYSHAEDDIRTVSNGATGSEVVITPTIKHYPPDTQAASLWLRNRQPKLWRDKMDLEHTGKDGGVIKHSVKIEFL